MAFYKRMLIDRLYDALDGNMKFYVRRGNGELKRAAVYEWLSGKSNPNIGTLRQLCVQTNCSADWLYGLKDDSRIEGPITGELPNVFERLEAKCQECGNTLAIGYKVYGRRGASCVYRLRRKCAGGFSSEVKMPTVFKIVEATGCSIDYLLGLSDE